MKFHAAAIIVIVVSMLFIGATSFIDDLGGEYNQTADYSGINATMGQIDKQQDAVNETYNKFIGITLNDQSTDFIEVPYVLITGGWTAIITLFTSWGVLFTMLGEISGMLNLPNWVGGGIFTIVVTLLVAMIIYLIFKWQVKS